MFVRISLFVCILIGMLVWAPAAGIGAAQRLTPTPDPTTIRPRLAARPTVAPTVAPTATRSATDQVDAARIAVGKQVYRERYCGSCHRLAAVGTTGIFGPAHDHIGTVAAQRIASPRYRGAAKTAAEYIRESIVMPGAFLAPTAAFSHQQMPPFTNLSSEELDALVYFLVQQK
jgi:nitric oxide reductase subunit C